MKKVLAVCILAVFCCTAFASATGKFDTQELKREKNIYLADLEHVMAMKAAGTLDLNDPAYLRVIAAAAAEFAAARHSNSLDQGADICPATHIGALNFTDTGSTVGAGNDVPGHYGESTPQVLYEFTATSASDVTASLCGSGYDTEIVIHQDDPCPGATYVTSNDDFCGLQSQVTFTPVIGTKYYVIVGGYFGSTGDYVLNVTQDGGCLADGSLAAPGVYSGNTCGAVNNCGLRASEDLIIAVSIPYAGDWHIYLCDQTIAFWDSYLLIGTGCCTNDVGFADDGCASPNYYLSDPGCRTLEQRTYYVTVEGFGSSSCGDVRLTVEPCVPPTGRCCYGDPVNPSCADVTSAECDGFGGVWDQFSSCAVPCPALGRCCYGDPYNPTCIDTYQDDCAFGFGGIWTAGVSCATAPCEPFVCDCGTGAYSHCNTTGGPINDVSVNDFTINVPVQYHITDVNVCWDGTHTYDGDVEIRLTSPMGTTIILVDNRGSFTDNWVCTSVDDEAGTPVSAGAGPFTGNWIPDQALSAFDGQDAYGDWTITFDDQVGGDFGALSRACLSFEYDYILAAELSAFTATPLDGAVELNWSTSSETDNDRFEIVRDGAVVASVSSQGETATGHSYSWTDAEVVNGTTYSYTLVAVDVNGGRADLRTIEATPNLGVAEVSEYALHTNFPNPFNPETAIMFDLVEAGNVKLTVVNLLGQTVATLVNGQMDAGRHTVNFTAGELPSGVYLYTIEVNGFSAQKKMVLMK